MIKARIAIVIVGVVLLHAGFQRSPKKPSTNRIMTTAPTIQTILFTMNVLCWRELSKRGRPAHIALAPS